VLEQFLEVSLCRQLVEGFARGEIHKRFLAGIDELLDVVEGALALAIP
jgi:hypothetical protein